MEKLEPQDPRSIGGYRLIGRLGEGGMGRVYLARSDRGRTVAVKLVRDELVEQEEFRARFRQEVRAARRVGGTWTAPVLDADTEAATPWVATGYIAGPSLQRVIAGNGRPLPERSVRLLAAGLARALQAVHAAGIIHRDLKPSNVLITIDGPRVIDFGIARALEATVAGEGLTHTGSIVGTPGFLAPEQVRGERLTAASDVFCLGSVLAFAATARLPFGGANSGVHAVLYRIAQEEPDLTELPEGLRELVTGCLAKSPEDRPTLEDILARTSDQPVGDRPTLGEALGRIPDPDGSDEPWLPGPLIAQLGRHATELLETEHPSGDTDGDGAQLALPPGPSAGAGGAAGAVMIPAPPGSPPPTAPDAAAAAGPPPPGPPAALPPAAPAAWPAASREPSTPSTLHHLPTEVGGTYPVPPQGQHAPQGQSAPQGQHAPPEQPQDAQQVPPPQAQPQPEPQPQPQPQQRPSLALPPAAPAASDPSYPGAAHGAHSGPPTAAPGGYVPVAYYPHTPPPEPAPRRNGTPVLIAALVALLIVVSGVTAYALLDDGDKDDQSAKPTAGPSESKTDDTDVDGAPNPSPTPTDEHTGPDEGVDGDQDDEDGDGDGDKIPSGYLGTWERSFGTGDVNTFRLVLSQGELGDTVMSLSGDGPTFSCRFQADLRSYGPPVQLSGSRVTYRSSQESCADGPTTTLRLTGDGKLRRTFADGRKAEIFTKAD